MSRPPEPEPGGVLSRDPVRWTWVLYGFVQTILAVFLATSVISERIGAIVSGVCLAGYIAVSELFTRPQTVPRVPLNELAEKEKGV